MKRYAVIWTLWLAAPLTLPQMHAVEAQTVKQKPAHAVSVTDGEIRRIDKDSGKLTIRHGPILNLNMPAMTMVFPVKNPALLETVMVGDKIRFTAERIDGVVTVITIEPAT